MSAQIIPFPTALPDEQTVQEFVEFRRHFWPKNKPIETREQSALVIRRNLAEISSENLVALSHLRLAAMALRTEPRES